MPTTSSTGIEGRTSGLTLVELLLVLGILAVLFGIGVGAFRRLATEERLASSQILDALRQARLFARQHGVPAAVDVDPEHGLVTPLALRPVGNWHFEDVDGTGWPVAADHPATALVSAGVVGHGLVLGEEDRLVIPLPPSAGGALGLGLDVYLAPDADPRPMVLLERPGGWSVRLDEDDRLQIELVLARTGESPVEVFRSLSLGERNLALPGPLPPGTSHRLQVVFDGRRLACLLDGERLGEDTLFPERRRLAVEDDAPLRTGSSFRGALDELRLLGVAAAQEQPLPAEVRLLGPWRQLHFDARGHLDPGHHLGTESIVFAHGDPERRTTIEISSLGTLRTLAEAGP